MVTIMMLLHCILNSDGTAARISGGVCTLPCFYGVELPYYVRVHSLITSHHGNLDSQGNVFASLTLNSSKSDVWQTFESGAKVFDPTCNKTSYTTVLV